MLELIGLIAILYVGWKIIPNLAKFIVQVIIAFIVIILLINLISFLSFPLIYI